MSSATWGHQIDLLVRARTPLIWVRSNEEARVESLLGEAAQRLARQLVCWNFIDGISGPVNADGQGSRQPMAMLQWLQQRDAGSPTLLLAKDFHRFCDDPGVARMLRNLEASLRSTPHTLVLCCGQWTPPGDLEESLTLLDLPLPDSDDLRRLISSIGTSSGSPLPAPVLDELAQACSGLSEMRVRQVAARALARRGQLGSEDLQDVLDEKRQTIARSEVLEFCRSDAGTEAIGGLDGLKTWLNQRHRAFSEDARRFGLPLPRGVLLVGPQGTGKSLTAKAIACSDGGTTQRVLANVLTWMAEKQSPVFVVATANGVEKLPPELLRKGRFDEIFMLDLPSSAERRSILELHLERRRPGLKLPLETVVSRSEGFSGAELEQTVIEAMHLAFADNRELTEPDLIGAASQLIPLSRTASEQLERLKQWADGGRARPASVAAGNEA